MQYQVKNFMYSQNMYVYEDTSLQNTEDAMKANNVNKICVLDSFDEISGIIFQKDIDFIKKRHPSLINSFKAKDLISPYSAPINVYPQNNIGEVLNTMKKLNLECLPVCKSPDKKQLIGFINAHIHFPT